MTDNDDRNADVDPGDQDIADDAASKGVPGTGGPDDPGDADVDDEDFDLPAG